MLKYNKQTNEKKYVAQIYVNGNNQQHTTRNFTTNGYNIVTAIN